MSDLMIGALLGASLGFLGSALLSPMDALGVGLAAIGAVLQVVYWVLKLKRRTNG